MINNQKVENGAALVAKYKGIRFFDADIEGGTYYRARSDQLTWAGKRAGGWLATCDEMPASGPSEDPAEDKERSDKYDPEVYVINVELHRMIVEADQAAGIIIEAADEEEEEEESPSTPVTYGHETKKQHTARQRRTATEEHTKGDLGQKQRRRPRSKKVSRVRFFFKHQNLKIRKATLYVRRDRGVGRSAPTAFAVPQLRYVNVQPTQLS